MTPSIPDKLFFKIGEVSSITELEPYILRYWESEFPVLKPDKNKAGQRLYTKEDIELVMKIKGLLYDEKYTIEGARRLLVEKKKADVKKALSPEDGGEELRSCLKEVKKELQGLLDKLEAMDID